MKWQFVEVQPFLARRDECFRSDADFRSFQLALMQDPERWGVLPGAAPLRKARWGDESSGRGKRGGIRVIYMQVPESRRVFLLHVYSKTRLDNLSQNDARILSRLARELRDAELERLSHEEEE